MALPFSMRCAFALTAPLLLSSCVSHQTAVHWNGHTGADDQPIFVQTSTYWGCHLGIGLPLFGHTGIDSMIDVATARISPRDGSHLRVVETESNNYWASVPPLSWLFTPVLTSVSIEYRPSAAALAAASGSRPAAPSPTR